MSAETRTIFCLLMLSFAFILNSCELHSIKKEMEDSFEELNNNVCTMDDSYLDDEEQEVS